MHLDDLLGNGEPEARAALGLAGGGRPPPVTRWAVSNHRPYRDHCSEGDGRALLFACGDGRGRPCQPRFPIWGRLSRQIEHCGLDLMSNISLLPLNWLYGPAPAVPIKLNVCAAKAGIDSRTERGGKRCYNFGGSWR